MDSMLCQKYALVRNDPSPFLKKSILSEGTLCQPTGIFRAWHSSDYDAFPDAPRGWLFAISEEAVAPMRRDFPGIFAHGAGGRFVRQVRTALVLTLSLLPSL